MIRQRQDVIASPSVRARAARRGIDLAELALRLNRTTIAIEDLEKADTPFGAPSPWQVDHSAWGPIHKQDVSRHRHLAAERLTVSAREIPAVTHHDRADVTALEAFRRVLRAEAGSEGVRVTALAFVVRALAICLRRHPVFNASLSADAKRLVLKDYVHVGVAVETEHGLVVPVVRDADRKKIAALSSEIARLADVARRRRLPPAAVGGASMTVSNLGGFGGTGFTPIVNPPEVAILGINRTEQVLLPGADGPVAREFLPLSLSYDHRVADGADAARFLSDICACLATPLRLLV